MAPKFYLRVNGMDISKAWVRNRLIDGSPFGRPEVVIDVPAMGGLDALGEITMEESHTPGLSDFKVEVRQGAERDWREIRPAELAALLTEKGHG